MTQYLPLFLKGMAVTCAATVLAGSVSLAIGTLLGIASCNRLTHPALFIPIKIFTFIAKGIPAYVQILIAYFIVPSILNIDIPAFFAACSALAFCSAGYTTEIIRSGINAVPNGQWDACITLGYPVAATIKRIIAPQALRVITPALFGELEQLVKSSSLLATIGVTELTRTGMNIISRELNPIPVYLAIAAAYLLFSALLTLIALYMEKRLSHGRN
ncbi:MAG TPA: amino acid ABC transporter permease [Candidatus Babeliales bacterium]|nr:amino acid ABC transporter permease [Candidatus Babeliales bacterium]